MLSLHHFWVSGDWPFLEEICKRTAVKFSPVKDKLPIPTPASFDLQAIRFERVI
jgi:hypothetical protein